VVDEVLQDHYPRVARAMFEGSVVPLLGAGVNLCGRPTDIGWERGKHLPSGAELAEFLATVDAIGRAVRFSWPSELDVHDARLQRVSEMEPAAWWGSTRYPVLL